jgi:hypothetical protein
MLELLKYVFAINVVLVAILGPLLIALSLFGINSKFGRWKILVRNRFQISLIIAIAAISAIAIACIHPDIQFVEIFPQLKGVKYVKGR